MSVKEAICLRVQRCGLRVSVSYCAESSLGNYLLVVMKSPAQVKFGIGISADNEPVSR